jgi:hypothetical protein
MNHTPGPWKWKTTGYRHLMTTAGADIHDFGCGCCSCTGDLSDADARLIAAAPELLEALEFALAALEDVFGKNKVDVGAINTARAAIARARGQE